MTQDKPYAKGAVYPFSGGTMSPLTLPPLFTGNTSSKEKKIGSTVEKDRVRSYNMRKQSSEVIP